MKKIILATLLTALGHLSYAEAHNKPLPLDKVGFQLSAKAWVSTQTVLVNVHVDASLNSPDVVKMRDTILNNLNQIVKGDWHIVQFDRSQDSSGLDKLSIDAQVRVPQSALQDVYQRAKTLSKPGITYTMGEIAFKPDLQDVQNVRTELRQKLYQMVNTELAVLNKTYPEQHYTVNTLYFAEGEALPAQPIAAPRAYNMAAKVSQAAAEPALTVSNELVMHVVVEAASNRQQGPYGQGTPVETSVTHP